jgi:hypothetical protein
MRPPRPFQGTSPRGDDLQLEPGRSGEEARCVQGATQETPDRQTQLSYGPP